jgi:Cu2+-exporting ATPase
MDSEAFEALYVEAPAASIKSCLLVLEGVACGACLWLVERLPTVHPGLVEARLSLQQGTVRVTWDTGVTSLSQIASLLARVGYRPHPARSAARDLLHKRAARSRLIDTAVAGALAGNIMLLAFALYSGLPDGMEAQYEQYFRYLSGFLGVLALAWPGRTFFISSWRALAHRSINLDVPITMALVAGGLAGTVNIVLGRGEIYFDSLAALVFLLLVGRQLQHAQQRRADRAVELLFSLMPQTARRLENGVAVEVPSQSLNPGDLIRVLPGELLPADGLVSAGASTLNAAVLTGESLPIEVCAGDVVYGSAQNLSGTLEIRVTAAGTATRAGKLMELVQRGIETRSPIVRHADRVGVLFTVVVSVVSVITFAGWATVSLHAAVDHTVAMLIVTCPCVLGLATPLTMAMSIGQLARRGILVKSAESLEKLASIGPVILDKTGTLTTGQPTVTSYTPLAEVGFVSGLLLAMEQPFAHPIAQAVTRHLAAADLPALAVTDIRQAAGGITGDYQHQRVLLGSPAFLGRQGVEVPAFLQQQVAAAHQLGHTIILLALGTQLLAVVTLADTLKPDAAGAINQLRRHGALVELATGDNHAAAITIAGQLDIGRQSVHAEQTPEDKLALIKSRVAARIDSRARRHVIMIGDGINDAAALAAADVGIAVRGGAEASLTAADVYLSKPGLSSLTTLTAASRHTLSIIRTNLCLSLAYNVLAAALAIAGLMHPLIAAILMPLSSLTVVTLTMFRLRNRDCQ